MFIFFSPDLLTSRAEKLMVTIQGSACWPGSWTKRFVCIILFLLTVLWSRAVAVLLLIGKWGRPVSRLQAEGPSKIIHMIISLLCFKCYVCRLSAEALSCMIVSATFMSPWSTAHATLIRGYSPSWWRRHISGRGCWPHCGCQARKPVGAHIRICTNNNYNDSSKPLFMQQT